MSKLTREQVKTWNQGNQNGFEFDITYYLYHGEKTISKQIELDDKHVLTVHLMYRTEMVTKCSSSGCKYTVETGKVVPVAHFAESYRSGACLVSHGLGYWQDLDLAVDKKNYKALQTATASLSDARCLELFATTSKTQVNRYA